MALFDIIQGVSSSINQFSGGQGSNQLVPPLEVDDSGLIGDGFNWLEGLGEGTSLEGLGGVAANLLRNTYTPVAIRRSLTGLPYGGQRPVNNISTRINVENETTSDWRLKLMIPIENPIYEQLRGGPMAPLSGTGGVIFPYTPQVETQYAAEYEDVHPTHSNYATPAYNRSKVDNINISADFSSNDAIEAAYSMAVIHFFRTVTKMFYGNDGSDNGRPPPILYLRGYGAYMFPNIPVVCKSASITLQKDVDYVAAVPGEKAGISTELKGLDKLTKQINERVTNILPKFDRFSKSNPTGGTEDISWVPSQFAVSIHLQPIYSRTAIAENFSLKKFANGSLTRDEGFI